MQVKSFEQEILEYFGQNQIEFTDHSASLHGLDFSYIPTGSAKPFYFDTKEKRQRYNLTNWPKIDIPEASLFILDDLSARKVLACAPHAGLIVRDNVGGFYYFFSVVDLFLMPKKRANRPIKRQVEAWKGKWLIDLRNGRQCNSLTAAFTAIAEYESAHQEIFDALLECYGSYVGEELDIGGMTRLPKHWSIDRSARR